MKRKYSLFLSFWSDIRSDLHSKKCRFEAQLWHEVRRGAVCEQQVGGSTEFFWTCAQLWNEGVGLGSWSLFAFVQQARETELAGGLTPHPGQGWLLLSHSGLPPCSGEGETPAGHMQEQVCRPVGEASLSAGASSDTAVLKGTQSESQGLPLR